MVDTPSGDGESVIRVEPSGIEIALRRNETLLDAALRVGILWPTTCYGQATCTMCAVETVSGEEHLSERGTEETEAITQWLSGRQDRARTRLACRLTATGPATVKKRGVRAGRA